MAIGVHHISLRIGIFVAVFLATLIHLRHEDTRSQLLRTFRTHPARWPLAAVFGMLVIGGILGMLRHPFARFASDANAWGFLLLTPAFVLAMHETDKNGRASWRSITSIVTFAALYLIVRSLLLLFAFSHDLGGLWFGLYRWVRDTRLGEVTVSTVGFPRVFLPSMVLLFPAMLLAARSFLARTERIPALMVVGGGFALLVASLSRSFWLAAVVLLALMIVWRAVRAFPWFASFPHDARVSTTQAAALAGAIVAGLFLAWGMVRLPYPTPLTTAGLGSAFADRLTLDEPAVSNRWQQLRPLRTAIATHPILGNGFGAAVTYESKDPRTLAAFPDGKYTATAFEWGYLDHLLETGYLGLLAFLWLLATLIVQGLRRGGDAPALALGLLAIALVHVTSPYLNHPLGIGMLMALIAMTTSPTATRGSACETDENCGFAPPPPLSTKVR
jgi:hypothetical protein